jgi:hypothetical protein
LRKSGNGLYNSNNRLSINRRNINRRNPSLRSYDCRLCLNSRFNE